MIIGLGTDILEIERLKLKLDKNKGLKEKVFAPEEILECEAKGLKKYESYAARFAAKEAFLKAIGINWICEIEWNAICILNEKSGKPFVKLFREAEQMASQKNVRSVWLSMSHSEKYATATVILES